MHLCAKRQFMVWVCKLLYPIDKQCLWGKVFTTTATWNTSFDRSIYDSGDVNKEKVNSLRSKE